MVIDRQDAEVLKWVFEQAFSYVENETVIPELPPDHRESIMYEKAKKLCTDLFAV